MNYRCRYVFHNQKILTLYIGDPCDCQHTLLLQTKSRNCPPPSPCSNGKQVVVLDKLPQQLL